jgi:hypothetical protein
MQQGVWIVVRNGPDRGRSFALAAEVQQVGRASANDIVLSDPDLLEHHFSVLTRDGQCSMAAASDGAVVINGQPLSAEQWIEFKPPARIQLTVETEIEVVNAQDLDAPAKENGEGSSSIARRRAAAAQGKVKKKAKGGRQVAKFLTDRPGDPLVRLGSDGRLPELALSEAARATRERNEARSPWVLYAVLGLSMLFSTALLLIDADPKASPQSDRELARQQLAPFYRGEESKLQPYQTALRQATIAHAQNDAARERQRYFAVLDLLDAADVRDPSNLNGLTGKQTGRGRSSDAELRAILERLVAR